MQGAKPPTGVRDVLALPPHLEAPATSKEAPLSNGDVIELGPSTEKLSGDILRVYQTWSVQGLTSIRSIADATGIGRTKVNLFGIGLLPHRPFGHCSFSEEVSEAVLVPLPFAGTGSLTH